MPYMMIAASIGAQLFNSWQANKKSEKLQLRQREFQLAAQTHDFERMHKLQREAAQLALELEAEVHKQRLQDIESNYDDILSQFANDFAIKLWPLKVLPFVMRGESFGTYIRGTKSIALHCILTPSNCEKFNEAIYQDLDLRLECLCNEHWNAQSSHPIVYYGGGWRKSKLDLDDISLLHSRIKSIPTVVITPYFDPNLHFKVKLWGMGIDSEFRINLPDNMFSYDYVKDMEYFPKEEQPIEDLYNHTIDEFVPYLECLIGFIADKYFWEMYKIVPALPHVIYNMKHAWDSHLIDMYKKLYDNTIKSMTTSMFSNKEVVSRYNQMQCLISYSEGLCCDEESTTTYVRIVNDTFNSQYRKKDDVTNLDVKTAQIVEEYNMRNHYNNLYLGKFMKDITTIKKWEFEVINIPNTSFNYIYDIVSERKNDTNGCGFFYFCIWNSQIVIGRYGMSNYEHGIYIGPNTQRFFIFYTGAVIELSQDSTLYYKLEIKTKLLTKMEDKKFEDRFGDEFAKIGKSLGRIIDSVGKSGCQNQSNSVWDSPQQHRKNEYTEKLISYFTQRVNNNTIEAVVENNLTTQLFLDWIDANHNAFVTKAYVIKGYVQDKGKHLFCIFFADDKKVYIGENDHAKCFISVEVNEEMMQMFGQNNVCEIPLKF